MGWLLNWQRRRFVRKAFKRYVSKDVIRSLESGTLTIPPPTRKVVNFAIFSIKDEDGDEVKATLNIMVPSIIKNNGMVMGFPTVLLATFEDESKIWSGELSLLLQSPDLRAKGLYGQVECLMGNWSGPGRMSYGPLIPGLGRLLARLDSLNYGAFEQV